MRMALGCVVLLGAVLALAVGAAHGATRSTPGCAASELTPVFVDSSGAAGSIDVEYGFKNRSTQRCELQGYPTLRMLKASGGSLATTVLHAHGSWGITVKPVVVAPGSVAYFGIHFAAATGYGRLHCPTSAALRLTAPGTTTGLVLRGRSGRIQPYGGTTEHLHCGIVHVSAVTAKRFQ